MYGYIYLTTNLINNKKYIGMHKSEVFDPSYKGSGKIILQALEKYGEENFKVEVLKECSTSRDLYDSERLLIEQYDAVTDPNFYNLKEGGSGGYKVNGVSIKKGTTISEQARINTSLAHKGIPLSEEHRRSIGNSIKGNKNPLRCEGSEVARQHLSNSMKGNKNSLGTIWITNGTENKKVRDLENIPDGWYKGQTNSGLLRYKYCWVTKDNSNIKIREDFLNEYISKGYKRGRYIPPRRATTIESIGNEKDITE